MTQNRAMFLAFAVWVLMAAPAAAQVYVPATGPSAATNSSGSTLSRSPKIHVPEMGRTGPALRFPDRIEAPRMQRYHNRAATVPAPTAPHAGRIQVPGVASPGETSQDRIKRCSHYGALYGGGPGYVNSCLSGN
jgi:hypothetical protein